MLDLTLAIKTVVETEKKLGHNVNIFDFSRLKDLINFYFDNANITEEDLENFFAISDDYDVEGRKVEYGYEYSHTRSCRAEEEGFNDK